MHDMVIFVNGSCIYLNFKFLIPPFCFSLRPNFGAYFATISPELFINLKIKVAINNILSTMYILTHFEITFGFIYNEYEVKIVNLPQRGFGGQLINTVYLYYTYCIKLLICPSDFTCHEGQG